MKNIDEMLEKAIEIEGLIRILRDGRTSEETCVLLNKRIEELTALATREPEGQRAKGPEDQRAKGPEGQRAMDYQGITDEALEQEIEDDVRMEEAESEELKIWGKMMDSNDNDDDIILTLDDEKNEEDTREKDNRREKEDKTGKEEMRGKEDKKAVRNLKSVFSLNDRFLYARELFDNNMKAFDSTLKSLEGVDDFKVVEEYLYNELDWDRENPTVQAFIEAIQNKF